METKTSMSDVIDRQALWTKLQGLTLETSAFESLYGG